MKPAPTEFEGTWEEILEHAGELAGHRVRVTVLSAEPDAPSGDGHAGGAERRSSARSLLKYAGKWSGDDLEERLREVYENRTQAKF